MPTLNEAAVTLRLRAALKGIRTVLSGAAPIDRGIALLHRDREEIEQHLAALAADPGPLVAAVEGVVGALEAQPCRCPVLLKCPHCEGDVVEGADQYSGSWICRPCMKTVGLPKDPARPCARCAALAAWKEATRG